MKYRFTFYDLALAALASVSLMMVACERSEPEIPEPEVYSYVLECQEESTVSLEYRADAFWEVFNDCSWFSVGPLMGSGSQTMTVTSVTSNDGMAEREGVFIVSGDEKKDTCHVIQRGTPGVAFVKDTLRLKCFSSEVMVAVNGNIDYEFVSAPDWIKFVKKDIPEPKLLSDGVTYSQYYESKMIFDLSANEDENNEREGKIVISAGGKNLELVVIQRKYSEMDYETPFYRNILAIRFTATWCGYCPRMGSAFSQVMEDNPGRVIGLYLHPSSSQGGLAWANTSFFEQKYKVTGYPSGVINGYGKLINYPEATTVRIFNELIDEAIESYPSKTAVAAESVTGADGNFTIKTKIAMREGLDYMVSAFVLEDGIVFPQNSGGDDYVHNFVVRSNITDVEGEPVPNTDDNVVVEMDLKGKLPSSIKNKDNAYFVIYVSYPGDPEITGVSQVEYLKGLDIIDNAVRVGLNDKVDFRYEAEE